MDTELDEAAWRRALGRGDADAVARLYDTYLDDILGWCRRLGGGLLDPEDAAHDVFVVALARIGSFEGRSSLRTWLFGVTRRVLANHRRRVRVRQFRERLSYSGRLMARDRGPSPAENASLSERRMLVHRCLDSLSRKHREVLVLCSLEGRTGREAAQLLGIPEATVCSRLHYARAAFGEVARRRGLVAPGEGDGGRRKRPRRGGRR